MRIEQRTGFLGGFVRSVHRGALVPAAFQRPYVWSTPDVIAMCDSLLEGYPLGSFLIWAPHGKADLTKVARGRIGPVRIESTEEGDVAMLLDGQNRLATLAWMTYDFGDPLPEDLSETERQTWGSGQRLVLELGEKRFAFVDARQANEGFRLPAYALQDTRKGWSLIRERWDTQWSQVSEDERNCGLKWYDEAAAAFSNAQVTATWIEHAGVTEAKRAFLHICRVGVPMSESDFDAATSWCS